MNTISEQEYSAIKERIHTENKYIKSHGLEKNGWISVSDMPESVRVNNDDRAQVELYEWIHNPPDRYFLYIREDTREAINWTGIVLGRISFGKRYRSCFGDERVSIVVYGNNGKRYYGTFYRSAGDYARIRAYKA